MTRHHSPIRSELLIEELQEKLRHIAWKPSPMSILEFVVWSRATRPGRPYCEAL